MSDGESIAGREREVTFHTSGALTPHFFTEFDKEARSRESRDPFYHDAVRLVEEYRAALNTITQQAQELEGIDDILARRPALADCVTRRDKIETAINVAKQVDDIKQQLSASQARCREMETELQKEHERSTAHFDLCVHKDTELAQLQATLAAREARVRELEDQMNAKRYVTNEAL